MRRDWENRILDSKTRKNRRPLARTPALRFRFAKRGTYSPVAPAASAASAALAALAASAALVSSAGKGSCEIRGRTIARANNMINVLFIMIVFIDFDGRTDRGRGKLHPAVFYFSRVPGCLWIRKYLHLKKLLQASKIVRVPAMLHLLKGLIRNTHYYATKHLY